MAAARFPDGQAAAIVPHANKKKAGAKTPGEKLRE